MRYQGKITHWKDEQGFGFITPNEGGKQVFVHIKSFTNRHRRPLVNETVTYQIKIDAKNREQTESVAFIGERIQLPSLFNYRNISLIVVLAFIGFLVWLAISGKLPFAILGLYIIASIIAFAAYALDKSAAKQDKWRTAENTLHIFALIGGWPGALAAQNLLRHKSSKLSFQIVFWITAALNAAVLSWSLWFAGDEVFRHIPEILNPPISSVEEKSVTSSTLLQEAEKPKLHKIKKKKHRTKKMP